MENVIFIALLIFYFYLINRILGFLFSSKSEKHKGVFGDTDMSNLGKIGWFLVLLVSSFFCSFVTYFYLWVKFISE